MASNHLFSPSLDDFGPPGPVDAPFKRFSFPGLYALFAEDGTCLYIGQSVSVPARLRAHKKKPWYSKCTTRRTLCLENEEDRLIREAVLILATRPRANRAIKLAKREDGSFYEIQWLGRIKTSRKGT